MTNLPVGWSSTSISYLSEVVGGKTPSKSVSDYWINGTIPWVSPKDMKVFDLHSSEDLISESALGTGMRLLPAGSVLLVARSGILAHTLPVAIANNPVTINQDIKAFLPAEDYTSNRFLAYQLRSLEAKILTDCCKSGTTVASVEMSQLEQLPIKLAPRPEQTRIADKLDTVLARVDAVNARLERVAPLLKRFRQAVLAAATSGRLTEEWRKHNSCESWEEACLGDVLLEKPRNGYSPSAVNYETGVRSLTLGATTSGKFDPGQYKFLDQNIPPDSHLWLAPGDILIQRANSLDYVGVSAIYEGPLNTFIYPDLMMKCRAGVRVSTRYLHILLSSAFSRSYFRANATGTAGNMPKINQQTVMSLPVQLPPTDEQTEIVRRVELLFGYADRLEARLKAAQTAAGRLTPALLAKAFRGELVPQDPNDEPASELLRRLAESRAAGQAASARKTRGRRATA